MIAPVASAVGAFCHCLYRRCSEPSLPLSPTESPQLPLLSAVATVVCCPLPLFGCCLLLLSAASTATNAVIRSTVATVLD
ncbi:hypothetical protein GW17_00010187 [Ensete ventricosum]|nr:hypothetical protein GW17_00010187 [Ensete ventricosum]